MADASAEAEGSPKSGTKKSLMIGLVLALLGGAAGFYVTSSGMLSGDDVGEETSNSASKNVVFVPVEQLTIAIGSSADRRFLRFRANIEVAASYEQDVRKLMPRVIDVLNTYLRSLEASDLEDPSSLLTLRSQMRRRIDLVVGGGKVNDLLVMEFVVN